VSDESTTEAPPRSDPDVTEVPVSPTSPERFRTLLGPRYAEIEEAIEAADRLLSGRVIWHVNSTARGGGVAEMLQSLLAYARGAGVDTRWLTIRGNSDFFRITKRIHNHLHGSPGDGGPLGDEERGIYESTLARCADELEGLVRREDVVYLHDPQTAGLIELMHSLGAHVVWRCHVGLDHPNDLARGAWRFLEPYVRGADAYVFSRRAFVWEGLEEDKLWLVPPSIDAFSPKNQDLDPAAVTAILARIGLGEESSDAPPVFERNDGTRSRVDRRAELDQIRPVPPTALLVAQVSRWDRLKDPIGLLRSFAEHLRDAEAELLLAGPSVAEVADDPEGAEVLAEVRASWEALPDEIRERVHLASLPMDDIEENAAMVNAIQRRADVVVQKSLAEGFGLTVAEAMWKARPVVASRIGGIQDQIVDGESGLLVDPTDPPSVAVALDSLLEDPDRREAMGAAARERVREQFLGSRHLVQYVALLERLLSRDDGSGPSAD
jgi:trehalose synthase